MRATFLMPAYGWVPSGGFKVVFEYANRLVARGHEVTVVQPRRLKNSGYTATLSAYRRLRNAVEGTVELFAKPKILWHPLDERVRLLYVSNSDSRKMPDGDVLIATSWATVQSVLDCPPEKGEKFYLIQGYETWMGPKELVDATWRAPLTRVVVSQWLREVGERLGCGGTIYIPNAVDHGRYRVKREIANRPLQVAMLYSTGEIKGSADGFRALEIVRRKFPGLRVVCFGVTRRLSWVPDWVDYRRNPPQDFIVDEIYNKSRVFVSSSWTEGFSLPAAEAAACGCAIVATDSGGIRDFVRDGVTGLLSAPKDPEALARNLCIVLQDDALRIRLASAGRECVAALDWDRSVAQLEELLSESVACRGKLARAMAPPAGVFCGADAGRKE